MSVNQALFDYIASSPTAYQAVEHSSAMLESAGYIPLSESDRWTLEAGKGYFVTRSGSALIAFRMPGQDFDGFMISAAHADSPSFKIKEHAEMSDSHTVRLSTERYGGMLCAPWFDRPLSIAGRALIRTETGLETRNVNLTGPQVVIPSVAIHMNREANTGMNYNAAVDTIPLYGDASRADTLRRRVSESIGSREEDLITYDLFLYNPEPGVEWNGLISSPRLDDLQCAFASLTAFLESGKPESPVPSSLPVYCLFDNEEVGSSTKQGAASTFLHDVLSRISASLGLDSETFHQKLASSFLASCDNGHAKHPNHPEYCDPNQTVYMNGGVVIKYNANMRYTTDAVSAALFRLICEKAGVPTQNYANRADMAGGSTLGAIADTKVSINTVDIGLAQLAMHSSYETAGADDTAYMIRALTALFGTSLKRTGDGTYTLS